MSSYLKAAKRGFVKGGGGVYNCGSCKRATRPTGNGDNENVRLCEECFDLAGEENSLSDNGEFYDSPANVLAMIAAVAAKGGNASVWDELKVKAAAAAAAEREKERFSSEQWSAAYPWKYLSEAES